MKLKKIRIRSKCDVPQGQVSEQVVVEEQKVVNKHHCNRNKEREGYQKKTNRRKEQ